MKTIKQCLAEADRNRLLDCLWFRVLKDPIFLLERKSCTVQKLKDHCTQSMNAFIDQLLRIEPVPSVDDVFYLCSTYQGEEVLELVSLSELKKDIEAPAYDSLFVSWEESLGYLVADTKLTQDNLIDLLAQYIEKAAFFGTDATAKAARIKEIDESIAEGISSLENDESRPADEFFDALYEEFGLPVPEKDDRFEELKHTALAAILDCEVYVRTRERKRILATAGMN